MDQWKVSLTMASTLEEIWRLRNSKLHSNSFATLMNSIQLVRRYVHDFIEVSSPTFPSLFPHVSPWWSPPPPSWIKINVDAALSSSKVAIIVVERDFCSSLCSVWAKLLSPSSWSRSAPLGCANSKERGMAASSFRRWFQNLLRWRLFC